MNRFSTIARQFSQSSPCLRSIKWASKSSGGEQARIQQMTAPAFNAEVSMLRLNKQTGNEVIVSDSNVIQAYNKLKRMTNDSKLRELERRYRWNIKPKHRRQQRAAQLQLLERRRDFDEKMEIALELMRQSA